MASLVNEVDQDNQKDLPMIKSNSPADSPISETTIDRAVLVAYHNKQQSQQLAGQILREEERSHDKTMASQVNEVDQDNQKDPPMIKSNSPADSPISETTTDSDEETMIVVTTNRVYYVSRVKCMKPIQEISQSASAELVLPN